MEFQELHRQVEELDLMLMEVFNRWLDRVSAYDDAHRPEAPKPTTMIATDDSAHVNESVIAKSNTPADETNPEDESTTGNDGAPPPGPDNQFYGSPYDLVHDRYLLYLVRKHTPQDAQGRGK